MATTTLSKWGNSTGVRIPTQFLKRLSLDEGAEVEILLTPQGEELI
ncbi:AbrB/MazE/SpoVT family DNA-binding domain-containing protein [Paenibacillus xerothermodurans]|nr:AbrB/MazE/SpoVT family DNA-binding domain-containing protein [Paenibacillus xerothermodurans]